MPYWETRPVSVTDTPFLEQIISNEQMLDLVTTDINTSTLNLNYVTYHNLNSCPLDNDKKMQILTFINEHYVGNSANKLIYSEELFDYFINDALIIVFFGKNEKIVGIIIGKFEHLIFKNNEPLKVSEVNFFCVHSKLRNLNMGPDIISVYTKELILQFNMSYAYYTIAHPIDAKAFCKKRMYHRCIGIDNLISGGFINTEVRDEYIQKYNTFSRNNTPKHKIYHFNNTKYDQIDILLKKLILFQTNKYDIRLNITLETMESLFNNKAFHHFIILDQNNEIEKYYCIFELKHKSVIGNYMDGIIYMYFNLNENESHP